MYVVWYNEYVYKDVYIYMYVVHKDGAFLHVHLQVNLPQIFRGWWNLLWICGDVSIEMMKALEIKILYLFASHSGMPIRPLIQ